MFLSRSNTQRVSRESCSMTRQMRRQEFCVEAIVQSVASNHRDDFEPIAPIAVEAKHHEQLGQLRGCRPMLGRLSQICLIVFDSVRSVRGDRIAARQSEREETDVF